VGAHFFQVPKDWEVKLRIVGDLFFNLSKKQRIGRVFWELLEMLLVVDISCYIKQYNACYAYS